MYKFLPAEAKEVSSTLNGLQHLSRRVMRRVFQGRKAATLREMVRVLPKDAIWAIDVPVFIDKTEAVEQMDDTERILGVEINGDARAYPLSILSVHEVVNDTVGGIPVSITWCPLSYSGIVYKRVVIDRVLSFGVSGGILRNVVALYDRETDTFWNQLTGDAFSGPLCGIKLEAIPAVNAMWEEWCSGYPFTQTLSKARSPFGHYDEDHMSDYYCSEKTGIRAPAHHDTRLPNKAQIVGINGNGGAVAYPIDLLEQARVIHDTLEDLPIVIFHTRDFGTSRIFSARIETYTLSFHELAGKYYDLQTNSHWSPLTGIAMSGPLKGQKLSAVPGTTAFWFAWADHFPDTRVYNLGILN